MLYYLQSRYYDPTWARFLNADAFTSTGQGILGNNMFAYCSNNPIMYADSTGEVPDWLGNVASGIGVAIGTVLFVGAIVASAGAVAALAGIGAAALGASAGTIATLTAVATNATYVVAGGVALFGANDAIEAATGGTNIVRDGILGGNQTAYNWARGTVNTLGTVAVAAGTFGPKAVQNIAKSSGAAKMSNGRTVGYQKNYFDASNNWSLRIDATTHGNPQIHHNPHYHVGSRSSNGVSILNIWENVKGWVGIK